MTPEPTPAPLRRRGGAQQIPRPQGWRLGGPAPWFHGAIHSDVDAVVDALPRELASPPLDGVQLSAVLVLLADGPEGAEVLLTRRTMALSKHRGEISFPGGRVDPGETVVAAALREAWEEVGLDAAAVDVVGGLDHVSTAVSTVCIVPVVGRLVRPVELVASEAEVDRILWVPLRELGHAEAFREEWWPVEGGERQIYFFELADETVWGATARILHQLLRVALAAERGAPAP